MPTTRSQKRVSFETKDGKVQFQISSRAAQKKKSSTRSNEQLREHMVGKLGLPEAFYEQAIRVRHGKGMQRR
jgi:hypothetical protein